MSDAELERIKRQRLARMQRNLAAKNLESSKGNKPAPEDILRKIFVGRAWEVYYAAKQQYPTIATQIFQELTTLVENGKIQGQITGEQLYGLLRQIGLDVRLDTKIQVFERGELKSIAEKFRGN